MEKIKQYLTNPATRISFLIFVFGLGGAWVNLNNRIDQLEKKTEDIDMAKIQVTLSQIQTDIEWIKKSMLK